MNPVILHIDMNSYFASVEQQANPFLRGKPVGVCATMTNYGCIIASSKEAKAKGIKTGCRVKDALFLDPKIVLVECDAKKYRSTTRKIFSILRRYTERIEPYSIDEAFLDLTGYVHSLEEGEALGKRLQQQIKDTVGEWLTCSIGVAPTRWLAKFAGDTAPKGTVLVLSREALPKYYDTVKLTDAWGIGKRMERRFNALGISTLNELRAAPIHLLTQEFGMPGYYLWANVNAIELGGPEERRNPKSIGHSHVLTDRRERDLPRRVLMKLCEKTGRRLRERKLQAGGLSVWWSFVDDDAFHRSMKMARPLFDTEDIFRPSAALLDAAADGKQVLALAVTTWMLMPRVHQLSFWSDPRARDALTHALDRVNDRYGEYTVTRGSIWATAGHAPERIGFRKTITLEEPLDEHVVIAGDEQMSD